MQFSGSGAVTNLFSDTPLREVKPGAELTPEQSKYLAQALLGAISAIGERRKRRLLVHESLRGTIGSFLQLLGWNVSYEIPFHTGGFRAERVVFDIVAKKDQRALVVEVKPETTSRDLGQTYGYMNILQIQKVPARVYLGTDILNAPRLLGGTSGETVKELMEREQMGIVLADKYLMVVCDNVKQLTLQAMPEIFVYKEKAK